MQKNPFVILGINADEANRQDVYEAYQRLRAKYSEERFLDGEAGAEASRKLGEVENAYNDALEEIEKRNTVNSFGSVYGEVENLIRENKLQEAQDKLDFLSTRDAEWHYLQSVIYYKRDWKSDSKKQLELAVSLAPDNQKYKTALDKLNAVIEGRPYAGTNSDGGNNSFNNGTNTYDGNGNPYRGNGAANGYGRSYNADNNNPFGAGRNTACDCCSSLICADCCCECMGGDLIRCC